MITVVTIVSGILLAAGALASVSAAVGVLRFPDFYTRLHAAGVGDTLGAGLILGALVLWSSLGEGGWVWALAAGDLHAAKLGALVSIKLVFVLVFLWISGTTACHALAKAAWSSGLEPWRRDGGGPSSS